MGAELPISKSEASGLSDADFLAQFEDGTLPYAHWTHRAHLRVAYLYLTRLGLEAAIPAVAARIRAFNRAKGIVDTPTGGYHETMTVAWLHVVAALLVDSAPPSPSTSAAPSLAFLAAHAALGHKNHLHRYYSTAHLHSPEAKRTFVPPDLAPLPGAR